MYEYQKSNRYFAQLADDIKDIAEEELIYLGARETAPGYRGIYFTADKKILYRINYHSRLINRVLAPLIFFKCHSDKYLYSVSSRIQWEDFIDPSKTYAVFASVSHSSIRHSKFASLRLKDAIADHFQRQRGKRPSVNTRTPDVWFNLHIENNNATISIDTSGGSLHRRGYRKDSVEAPMVETLAAAILKYAGWDGSSDLYDPFCGSGTFLCEAYLLASNTPVSFLRERFGLERLPDFDQSIWERVKQRGIQAIKPIPAGLIAGSDISNKAVKTSRKNCSIIDKEKIIRIEKKDTFDIKEIKGKTIICNPPYGIRLNNSDDLRDFYRRFGDFLKQRCNGSTAYVYFGERKYIKNIGLKPSWKKVLSNGGLDGRLVKYELY